MNVLPLLSYVAGLFDPYGEDHGERVSVLAVQLAKAAKAEKHYDKKFIQDLRIGAKLHDIGKMGIPEAIRRIQGRYLAAEKLAMRQHATIGAHILSKAKNGFINERVIDIALHHHENMIGDGYPDKLKGLEISLPARIVAICDRYDAMTHDRGYRRAMTNKLAIAEMIRTQKKTREYDPELLETFIKLHNN